MPARAAPRGTEKNNDPEDGENVAVFEEAARGWLGRADAVAFAQILFYQPLMANAALQETDPVGSSRATGRDPGGPCRRRLYQPVSDPGAKSFLILEIGDGDLLKCCQPVPLSATQRSDPQWAKPRSGTPEPIVHAIADGDCTDPAGDLIVNRFGLGDR
jgi:hypothetical protein